MTATLTKWYEEKGRHEIIAGGKSVNLPSKEHTMVLRADDVNKLRQHDLDDKGIAKTAREEKTRERDAKLRETKLTETKLKADAENARMMAMYNEHVLGVKPVEGGIVPISSILPAAPVAKPVEKKEEVGSFGD
jgi:7,8-dihydro-6-hydroxymethylpterin dimethyltransferase